jgi:hypothetical protein
LADHSGLRSRAVLQEAGSALSLDQLSEPLASPKDFRECRTYSRGSDMTHRDRTAWLTMKSAAN